VVVIGNLLLEAARHHRPGETAGEGAAADQDGAGGQEAGVAGNEGGGGQGEATERGADGAADGDGPASLAGGVGGVGQVAEQLLLVLGGADDGELLAAEAGGEQGFDCPFRLLHRREDADPDRAINGNLAHERSSFVAAGRAKTGIRKQATCRVVQGSYVWAGFASAWEPLERASSSSRGRSYPFARTRQRAALTAVSAPTPPWRTRARPRASPSSCRRGTS